MYNSIINAISNEGLVFDYKMKEWLASLSNNFSQLINNIQAEFIIGISIIDEVFFVDLLCDGFQVISRKFDKDEYMIDGQTDSVFYDIVSEANEIILEGMQDEKIKIRMIYDKIWE